ncbi:septal ring lytic transglycosylase RlpA family protein [Cylindrospermum sp. FACHB-282]|uniref:septal ring lytic transglycosylase RlpA family protein n=1 Tax=Cylindrospermum sp. FACHB-282 TaxID=2692794 RepID=UPI00168A2EBC|nr:septal ring lytic transglycosylase RlpA family protein [Cylindrospermum sp. FACHB-282]MBD2383982.1 septal ring lytic transglycosylase RlpA family protein [Cylindrospermum sp. FACHB-282]
MLLIGLLWITSWIGAMLSFGQNLPPSLTTKVLLTKGSASLGKLVNQHRPFFVLPNHQVDTWQTTLLPTRFWRKDWGSEESQRNPINLQNSTVTKVKDSKQQFCSVVPEIVVEQPSFNTASNLLAPTLIQSSSTQEHFFPQKILRSLQFFFRFTNPVEQSFTSASLPVAVVNRDEQNFEVWVNNRKIANLPNEIAAQSIKQRLTQLVNSPNLDATQLRPALVNRIPALMLGNRFLFSIDQQISRKIERSSDLLAIEWVNNLRVALNVPALTLLQGQIAMYGLHPSQTKFSGVASWYGDYFHGRLTANGETYNQNELTVAHRSLPFNTYLQVTNLQTGKAVIVRVNDRGPYIPLRSIDLSREAARCLGSEITGVVPYEAVILQPNAPKTILDSSSLANKPAKELRLVSDF